VAIESGEGFVPVSIPPNPPDELQSMLLDRLGITLPKRLRIDEIDLPITLSA
jgi:hypothetical protein